MTEILDRKYQGRAPRLLPDTWQPLALEKCTRRDVLLISLAYLGTEIFNHRLQYGGKADNGLVRPQALISFFGHSTCFEEHELESAREQYEPLPYRAAMQAEGLLMPDDRNWNGVPFYALTPLGAALSTACLIRIVGGRKRVSASYFKFLIRIQQEGLTYFL